MTRSPVFRNWLSTLSRHALTALSIVAMLTAPAVAGIRSVAPFTYVGGTPRVSAAWNDTVILGAPTDSQAAVGAGAVYVFRFDGSSWTQTQKLFASDAVAGDGFGTAVAIWGDRLVVGAENRNSGCGAAYVFDFDGSSWSQAQRIDPAVCGGAVIERFGAQVVLWKGRLAVGSPGKVEYTMGGTYEAVGAVDVYEHNGSAFAWTAEVFPWDAAAGDAFGASVDLWHDRLAVVRPGEVVFYEHDGSTWLEDQRITPQFGGPIDVAVWDDRAVISTDLQLACGASQTPSRSRVYRYQVVGGSWQETGSTDGAVDEVAVDVDISGGTTAVRWEQDLACVPSPTSDIVLSPGGRVASVVTYGLALWSGASCIRGAAGECPADALPGDHFVTSLGLYEDGGTCANGEDDDNDGLADAADPDCSTEVGDRLEKPVSVGEAVYANPKLAMVAVGKSGYGSPDWKPLLEGGFLLGSHDLTFDPNGDLVVIDATGNSLVRIDRETGLQQLLESFDSAAIPRSVDVEADGSVVVTDAGRGTVVRIDPATGTETLVAPAATLGDPVGIAVAADGTLVVTDTGLDQVLALDPGTGAVTVVASGVSDPADGSFDATGRFVFPETSLAQPRVLAVDHTSPGAPVQLVSDDPVLSPLADLALAISGWLAGSPTFDVIDPEAPVSSNVDGGLYDNSGSLSKLAIRQPVCRDRFDGDGDGLVDLADPDCLGPTDRFEGTVELLRWSKISDTQGGFGGPFSDGDEFGSAAAGLDDLDGDTRPELAVGVPWEGGVDYGAVHVLFLNADGSVASETKLGSGTGGVVGPLDFGDRFGAATAWLGDLDGAGPLPGAIAVGAPYDDDGGTERGAVYLLFLAGDGSAQSADEVKISNLPGLGIYDHFGSAIAQLDDLDGNGVRDLAVGTSPFLGNGAFWVLFLDSDGSVLASPAPVEVTDGSGGLPAGIGSPDFARSLAGLADVDGDGIGDIAVGASDQDAVYILYLQADGSVKPGYVKIADGVGGFPAGLMGDWFGAALLAPGDLDQDGNQDLVVGAPRPPGEPGAAWLLFLEPDGSVRDVQPFDAGRDPLLGRLDGGDRFGGALATLGDLAGDGSETLVVGAHLDDDGGSNRGAVWLLGLDGAPSTCGNSVVEPPSEECDDGYPHSNDGCSNQCVIEYCGDGVLQTGLGEQCDDGNNLPADGCTAACAIEICGNAVVDPGEQCDDGDTLGFDGCSSSCASEYALAPVGTAQGGSVSVTIAGVTVVVTTSAGQSDYEVAQLVAAAITADPTLAGLGVEAQALGGVLYVNGAATDLASADPGLLLSAGAPERACRETATDVASLALSGISVSDAWDGIAVSRLSVLYRRDSETLGEVGSSTSGFSGGIVAMTDPVTPQAGAPKIYLTGADGYVYKLDAWSGSVDWAVYKGRGAGCSDSFQVAPVFHRRFTASAAFQAQFSEDLVYVGTDYCLTHTENRIYAINAATGQTVWSFNSGATSEVDRVMGMVLDEANDVLYLTTDRVESGSQHSVWALDVLTGAVLWSTSVAMHWAAPVLASGRIYVASIYGELAALDAADGSILWTLPNGTGIPFASNLVDASFVPGNNRVALVDYLGNLWLARDDGASGSWEWSVPVPSPHNGWLEFDPGDGSLYTGGADGKLYAFDVATGALVGARTLDNDAASVDRIAVHRPAATSGDEAWILTGSADGTLTKVCTGGSPAPLGALSISDAFDGLIAGQGSTLWVRDPDSLAVEGSAVVLSGAVNAVSEPVLLGDSSLALFAAQADGSLSRVDPEDRVADWTASLVRPACPGEDSLETVPVVHLRGNGTSAFQAQYADDLVYAGTSHGCFGTANRIFALNAATGATEWEFNAAESVVMKRLQGMALDPESDTLFFTALDLATGHTPSELNVGAIDVLTGTLNWSLGDMFVRGKPLLRGDRVYVATGAGEFKALDKSDGSEIWSLSSGSAFWYGFDAGTLSGFGKRVMVAVDGYGDVWLALDEGASARWLWTTALPGGAVPALFLDGLDRSVFLDDIGGSIFVTATDGNIYQLRVGDGSLIATHAGVGSGKAVEHVSLYRPASAPGQLWLYAATAAGNVLRVVAASAPVLVPALAPAGLVMLALGFVGVGWWRRRRPFHRRNSSRDGPHAEDR